MTTTNILLVDDHKIIRDGLKSYFDNYTEYNVVAEAQNGKQALQTLAKNDKIDIVLTDITMNVMDGITLTKEVNTLHPKVKVIALTMLRDNNTIKKMLNAGVSGYLLKDCGKEEVIKAIQKVLNDEKYYSPLVTQTVMDNMMQSNTRSSMYGLEIALSERELEVLKLIIDECSNKEIADKLHISKRTVDAHKRNLLDKTGSKNIVGLVRYAINNHLID